MPETEVLKSRGVCMVYHDYYFVTCPERGIVLYQDRKNRMGKILGASIQGHAVKETSEYLMKKMYPWAELKQIPLVLVPIVLSDYT